MRNIGDVIELDEGLFEIVDADIDRKRLTKESLCKRCWFFENGGYDCPYKDKDDLRSCCNGNGEDYIFVKREE